MGAGLGTALSLGGALIQGIGAAKGTNAQAAQMYAQAGQVIAQGASTAKDFSDEATLHARQARLLRTQGSYDAARATEKGEQFTAAQEGAVSSNGFALSGSIADMVKTSAEGAGLDISSMRYGATMATRNEQILNTVYKGRAIKTLQLAGAEALDMVKGAKSIAGSAALAFAAPLINAGGTALKSSFA